MAKAILNIKIGKIKHKIPGVTEFVEKVDYKKFTSEVLYAKTKQKKFLNKFFVCDLVKNSNLNTYTFPALL